MSNFDDLVDRWKTARMPVGSAVDDLDEFHADLVLADVWVAEGVLPYVNRGLITPDVIGVGARLAEFRERLSEYVDRADPDSARVTAYLEYTDLLIEMQKALESQIGEEPPR